VNLDVSAATTVTERPLTEEERHLLSLRLDRLGAESRRALLKTGAASTAVCGVLAVITLLTSDSPRVIILAFWGTLAVAFGLWLGMPWRRLVRDQVRLLAEGFQANRAREIQIRSSRVVEFQEAEDEGACYAFEYDDGESLFVVGQEFYEDEAFPNSDFSIVQVLGKSGQAIDQIVLKRGQKLRPERVVPASAKGLMDLPEHLTVVGAPLDLIEAAVRRSPATA
jgi:hypothetical protein